jgi:hypothetical protein
MYKLAVALFLALLIPSTDLPNGKYSVGNTLLNIQPHLGSQQLFFYHHSFGALSAKVQEKSQWIITADDALFDLPKKERNTMYLVETHSNQGIPRALLSPLRFEAAPTSAVYRADDSIWTSEKRVNNPALGDSPYNWRSFQPAVPLTHFIEICGNRCDRGADERVIGASLQHAQPEMLHSAT